jgi:Na+/H+ antiporter 1
MIAMNICGEQPADRGIFSRMDFLRSTGVLHPWRRALLPVVAAMGATIVPAFVQVRLVDALDEPMLAVGWPVSLATDLAMAYCIARVIFSARHPVIPFLLLLGIASDAVGFLTVALFNPTRELHLTRGVLILAAAIGIAVGLRRSRVRSFSPYLLAAGGLSWYAFFWSGVHPALALVPVMPFLPHAARDPGFFVDALPDAKDTLSRFEISWRYPSQVALFFFGLVNAGVPMGALEEGTWGLPIAVLVGKPIGVLIGAGVATLISLHLPNRVAARPHSRGAHRGDGIKCRPLLLRRAPAARSVALGNEHGGAFESRGWPAGGRVCACAARGQVRTIESTHDHSHAFDPHKAPCILNPAEVHLRRRCPACMALVFRTNLGHHKVAGVQEFRWGVEARLPRTPSSPTGCALSASSSKRCQRMRYSSAGSATRFSVATFVHVSAPLLTGSRPAEVRR